MKPQLNNQKYKYLNINLNEIIGIYHYLKIKIQKKIRNKKWNDALTLIEFAAKLANKFNWIYYDAELEKNLRIISNNLISNNSLMPIKNRIIFYDSWGIANRGLTLQYLNSLKYSYFDVLIILENGNLEQTLEIRDLFKDNKKFEFYSLKNDSKIKQIEMLNKKINEFNPEILIMHISPWAVEALTVFYSLKNVTKYLINLTDHAFWLGSECLDFSLEFRDYGYTVSLEKRNIDASKICSSPYYPILVEKQFRGLPIENKDKVVILAGSSYYKIYGRNQAFFKIIYRLLNDNPELIILFAGNGDGRILRNFIKNSGFSDRLYLLGTRDDIGETFDHCDIYLSTYPISGGLMAQIAAIKSKPILSYTKNDIQTNMIDDLIGYNKKVEVSFVSETLFYDYATKLIKDKNFRIKCGQALKEAMITPEQFNENFIKILDKKNITHNFSKIKINYPVITDLFLEIENDYQDHFKRIFFKFFRLSSFWLFPFVSIKSFPALIRIMTKSSSIR